MVQAHRGLTKNVSDVKMACVAGEVATEAGGMRPGMHSCYEIIFHGRSGTNGQRTVSLQKKFLY